MERLRHIVEINIVLGAWLIAGPFIMGYSASRGELANDVALGVLIIGCSWWAVAAAAGQVGAVMCALLGGLWLIAAPFAMHYQRMSHAFANDIAVGILSVLVSATATWWRLTSRLGSAA